MRYLFPIVTTGLLLVACRVAPTPAPTVTPPSITTPLLTQSIDDEVRSAFAVLDPEVRRMRILAAIHRFLSDPSVQSVSDIEAGVRLTELAFASGAIKLTDPAYLRRYEAYAIVAIPDGVGLYFFAPSQPPLEINRFTIGLTTLNPVWRTSEIGVPYETRGTDGTKISQFALLTPDDSGWRVAWNSVDTPKWWFNSRNASLVIEPDLSRVAVVGQAPGNTLVFNESGDSIQRQFRITWLRNDSLDIYQPEFSSEQFASREAWLWRIAVPSPYATLVEFIERLQRDDREGLLRLVHTGEVIEDARDFGFALINQSYDVILSESDRLVIRGHQGLFEINFSSPSVESDPFIITRIKAGGGQ